MTSSCLTSFVFCFWIIYFVTIAGAQSDKDKCAASKGWSYVSGGSSFSASGGGASGGSSSSSSSASYACIQARVPDDCIRADPQCAWCAQPDFSGNRCNLEQTLITQDCSDIQMVSSFYTLSENDQIASRMSHSYGEAVIRVGDTVDIPFTIKEPEIYPVDFYYLMDVSYSMADDLENVKNLGQVLVETLSSLTKGGNGSVKLGFGKFVDKVKTPMTQMTPYALLHPYSAETRPPFLFQNVISLTSNVEEFQETLNKERVSGNLDPPEGALDAMLQVMECKQLIGWRGNALRLLMIATESAYHYAGDGAGLLMGISKSNDGQCHTGVDGSYTAAETSDYPTINQLVRSSESNSITPIFAVGETYKDLYEKISKQYFRGSTYGVLSSDSSNVVDLVTKAYKEITGKQELVTSNPDTDVICPWYHASVAGGSSQVLSVENAAVENLQSGSAVHYNMTLAANKGACMDSSSCNIGNVVVKQIRYDDTLSINTQIVAAFDCVKVGELNSTVCSSHGDYVCGICLCYSGWTGPFCNILDVGAVGCVLPGTTEICSGRGQCLNNRCQCDPGHRHFKEKIYGSFCECDDCPTRAGLVCANNGIPFVTPGTCSCTCMCNDGWEGLDCGCATTTETCAGLDGAICSGRGICKCGVCACDPLSGYGGPTCSHCLEDCPTCAKFQDCVQCRIHNTGPKNLTCVEECADYEIGLVDAYEINDEDIDENSGEVVCAAIDATDNCKFYYTYKEIQKGQFQYIAEKEKRCKPAYSLLIVLWVFLLVLLIGLILLCCWRCCVYVIDKEDARNYRMDKLARATMPAAIPLLPVMTAGSIVEFIKAKYLVRRSAKVAVIPVRRSFTNGETKIMWKTYAGSSEDDDFEVLSEGESGTLARKTLDRGEKNIEMRNLEGGNGNAGGGKLTSTGGRSTLETVNETAPLLAANGNYDTTQYDWGAGEIIFKDDEEFANIEIPLLHDFSGREIMFWVELHGQEKGIALGLKRTKVIVIRDEDAGIIGFPKPSYVFKENDQNAVVPIHRTVGMDGHVSVAWFTRDITAIDGKHYQGGRGVVNFGDGIVTTTIEIPLVPDILYDESEKAFNIELENPKGGATLDLAQCMITVLCDEECSIVQFPKEAYPFLENCGMAEINVIRTHSTKGVSIVQWCTEDDTAIAGKDYESASGTITFNSAVTEAKILVPIIDNDVYDENGRQFKITLFDPSEGTKLRSPQAVVTIIEDDEPGQFEFTKQSIVLRNDNPGQLIGKLPIIRSLGCDGQVTIPWFVQNHENKPIPDEIATLSGSVNFANQEVTNNLDLDLSKISGSDLYMFEVVLLQPTNSGKLGHRNKATVTVFGEEDVGSVGFAQNHFPALASVGMATILVSRKGNLESAAFVVCETSDQTAISGTHYRGGTSSIVFKANEAVKEVGIPIYNDPNHDGPLTFGVMLKSTPGGPKIIEPSFATVSITCMPMSPVYHAGFAAPGVCTIEFIKSKYLTRKSANHISIPVHRSSSSGECSVDWSVTKLSGATIQRKSSSDYEQQSYGGEESLPHGRLYFGHEEERSSIEINIEEIEIDGQQMQMSVQLDGAIWGDDRDEELRLGLRETEIVCLNDVDAGTLGFPKSAFSFGESLATVKIPVQRLGGMDGAVSLQWATKDDSAISGRDYKGGNGVIKFANNQITNEIEIPFISSQDYVDMTTERNFIIELYRPTGGAKIGVAKAVVRIVGDQERSIVQFSKPTYPVIGNSRSVQIPILRTGEHERKIVVEWYTQDGTAQQGIDYKLMRDTLVFEADITRRTIEVPLSGACTEPKQFTIHLQVPQDKSARNVTLGENNVATISMISSQEPGTFEFNKPSFFFRANTADPGLVPVIRSNGSDGKVILPWIIQSLEKQPSAFAGAEGFLTFEEGQISASIEFGLNGVPTDEFAILLQQPSGDAKLGSSVKTIVTILGEQVGSTVYMETGSLSLKTNEIVKVKVLREGNLDEPTYVAWKTVDGSAQDGQHYIGGTGNILMDPGECSKEIMIPVLSAPTEDEVEFLVRLTDVRGNGNVGDCAATKVTLEPIPNKHVEMLLQSVQREPVVEFTRKRHHFRQSQGTAYVPLRRSDNDGTLTIRWHTRNLSNEAAEQYAEQQRRSSNDDDSYQQNQPIESYSSADEDYMDWGSGTVTFENGDYEASIEFVLYREFSQKQANFKVELDDPWEKVNFREKECLVTVMKDKDAGLIGFGNDRFDFSCNDRELVIPIQRSSGADGTVSVPWFTRDVTAVEGLHYLPDDGNVVFRDGEVLRKITIPMPRRPAVFEEDEVAFQVGLGEPTGGAQLGADSTLVVLKNDVVPSKIEFDERAVVCPQSNGKAAVKVKRLEGTAGKLIVPWRVTSAPGKQKSRYEGINDEIVFQNGEDSGEIEVELPKNLLPTDFDYFVIELEKPRSGRAFLSNINKCHVTIDNDITSGTFAFADPTYSFNQSDGRGAITVVRTKGSEGEISLPWNIKSITPGVVPSVLHNSKGVVEFNPGQTEAKIDIPLPKDSENDEETFAVSLLPPGGRAKLGDPEEAEMHLNNDVQCTVGFTQPLYETRGDIDNYSIPVVREGPKGRQVEVKYKTKDGSAKDLQHYISDENSLCFAPGEDRKDIIVPILNDPSGERVTFDVELSDVTGPGKLSQHDKSTVAIDNLAGPGVFIMASPQLNVDQSKGNAVVTILRTRGRKGEVDIPWFAETKVVTKTGQRKSSSYDQLEGTLTFEDGEGQKDIVVPLEKLPQDDDETEFEVVLLTPTTGPGSSLGDPSSTMVTVNNDLGHSLTIYNPTDGGTIEMAAEKVEVFGNEKEVSIPVIRNGSTDHPCFVTWEAQDVSAVRGKHYKGARGNVSFEPGEQSKQIVIPIINDPTGDVMYFNVILGDTKGGAKIGDKKETQVLIDHVKEHGEIYFNNPKTEAKQSEGKFKIQLNRKTGTLGRVVVPWSISGADPMSPYNGLKGQETFKDGETESNIEIDVPPHPQAEEEENFTVQLGSPTGGAFLTDETTCSVRVVNDVMHGKIAFPDETIEAKQSEEVAEIPVQRTQRTEGRVRVPWATEAEDVDSEYNGLTGVETFEDGDKISTIKIPLSKVPSDIDREQFKVILGHPKTNDAVLGERSECTVNVSNDMEPALIKFQSPQQQALQSSGKAHIPLERSQRMSGRVIVPWKVIPRDPEESPYVGVTGQTIIEDGDDSADVEINLPKVALSEPNDEITIILEDPVGGKLGDDCISQVVVENDVGEGVVEMKNRNVTCSSDDGQCTIAVARKLGSDFPATIHWEAEDEDAQSGVHYKADKGNLKFKPGEIERPIHILLMNDPTGETRHFRIKITDVEGRDKLGEVSECKVRITNEATPPNMVNDFKAELTGPQEVHCKWSPPVGGAPVEGYKVSYWGKPGTTKTLVVPPEESDITLSYLDPSVTYQVAVRPYNDVGDGPISNTEIIDTQPELRLSYDTPQQFKTSEKTAGLVLTRNLTTFKTCVECKLIKEVRRKKVQKQSTADSSSESSSSSSSEDETDTSSTSDVLVTSELYFEPGQSSITVELPLDQEMRKTSQVFYLRVYPLDRDDDGTPLANIELHVINDTGIPGRVRKPFVASTTPRECVVTWEAPHNGGPVDGYKIVAESEDNPDVVAEVPVEVTKVQLDNLEPSTEYTITVQPFNSKGEAHPSTPAITTTQDELKVNFSEKHYSFKTSDKVAVIPIKRHFTHGYVTLHWKTQWSKSNKVEKNSSSSDSDTEDSPGKTWASGAVSFPDGQETADIQVPLKGAPTPKPNKTSYFYINIMDPNKQKRIAQQKCELIDDKLYGEIGFLEQSITVEGGFDAPNHVLLPISRLKGTDGDVVAHWKIDMQSDGSDFVLSESQQGSTGFSDKEDSAMIVIALISDWVDEFAETSPSDIVVNLTGVESGSILSDDPNKHSCKIRLIPASRGKLTVEVDEETLKWPPPNDNVTVSIRRNGGAYGRAYVLWKISSPTFDESDSDGDILEDWFEKCYGDMQMAHGQEEYKLELAIHTKHGDARVIPPKNPLDFKFEIDSISPGVTIDEGEKCHVFSIKPPSNRPGEVTFDNAPAVVKQTETAVEIPLLRTNGNDGFVDVDYVIHDGTAKAGKHFEGIKIDTVRYFDGEEEKKIVIPKTKEIYKDSKSFKVELKDVRNGGELGEIITKEVKLLPTFVEPPGKVGFPKNLQVDKKLSCNTSDTVVIPVERNGGHGGDVTVRVKTQDGSAKSGEHFVAVDKNITIPDGETKANINVPLLKSRYKNKIDFQILINSEQKNVLGKVTSVNIKLNPTITEAPGELWLPVDNNELVANANDTDKIVIPIVRKNGNGGEVSLICDTKDMSAQDGKHYKGLHKAKYVIGDLEDGCKIEIPVLKEKYRKDKEFILKMSSAQGGVKLKGPKEKKIVLKATDTEPCGKLGEFSDLTFSANDNDKIKIPINRIDGTGGTLCVNYQTKNGTAMAGQHFKSTSGTLKMKPGEDFVEIEIPIIKAVYKDDLNFKINFEKVKGEETISSPKHCDINLLQTYVEPPGSLSFAESPKEWSANRDDFVVIPIKRTGGHGGDAKVHVRTVDNSATAGKHFVEFDDDVTLQDGQTQADIRIRLIQSRYKKVANFKLEMSDPEVASLGESQYIDVILQPTITEPPGELHISDDIIVVDPNKANTVVIPIERHNGIGGDISFKCATKGGTAIENVHYEPVIDTFYIKDLQDGVDIKIPLKNIKSRQDLEFLVKLSDPEGGLEMDKPIEKKIILKATDTEPCGTIEISDNLNFKAVDGEKVSVPIKRVGGQGGNLTINYHTKSGTAKPGIHYVSAEGMVEMPPGVTETKLDLPLLKEEHSKDLNYTVLFEPTDAVDTIDKTVSCNITLGKTYIEPPGSFCIAGNDYDMYANYRENKIISIPVKRVGGSGGECDVTYKTVNGTATAGKDFKATEGVLSFLDGEVSKDIEIEMLPSKYRRDLKFHVELCDCTGDADIKRNAICVYLKRTDESNPGNIQLPLEDLEVSANKRSSLFVPVKRVGGTEGDVEVHYRTEDRTAKAGKHYVTSTGVMRLKHGESEGGFEIGILKDQYRNSLHFAVHLQHSVDAEPAVENNIQVNLLPTYISNPGTLGFNEGKVLAFNPLESNTAKIPLQRVGGNDDDIEFEFATKSADAIENVHFTPTTGHIVMPDKEDKVVIRVPLISTAEFTRPVAFDVEVKPTDAPAGLKLGSLTQRVILLPTKKEPCGVFGFTSEHQEFSAIDNDTISVLVKRTEGNGGDVTIYYFTRDNTAIAGTHYEETIGELLFRDGENEKYIEIPVASKAEYERPLTFSVELGATSQGEDVVGVYETGIILRPTVEVSSSGSSSSSSSSDSSSSSESDDGYPGSLGFKDFKYDFSAVELATKSHTPVAQIPVQRTESTSGKVSVDYFTRDNTAVAGVHYQDSHGKLVFKNGEEEKNINVVLNPNAKYSEPISFTAELGATSRDADVTIYETEIVLQPTIEETEVSNVTDVVTQVRVKEYVEYQTTENVQLTAPTGASEVGDPGEIGFPTEYYEFSVNNRETIAVPIERTYGQSGIVNVEWFTRENTAIADRDFVESSGIVEFKHGQAMQFIHIPVIKQTLPGNSDRTFIVELGQADNEATIGRYEATISLINDEKARLTAPKNVETEAPTPRSIQVTWEPSDNGQEYWVSYKRAGSREEPSRKTAKPEDGELIIEELEPESTYALVVTAIGDNGQQQSSDVISCSTPGKVPGPPNRLAFQVLSPTSLQCSWGEPAETNGPILSYDVLYYPTPDDGETAPVMVRIPDGHYRSLLVEDLLQNQTYSYKVRALNKWGCGEFREADMKIENMGHRPPSAIFLNSVDGTYVEQKEEIQERLRQEEMNVRDDHHTMMVQETPGSEVTTESSATKTIVTRYINKEGQTEPEKVVTEYEGKLTQEELERMAQDSQGMEGSDKPTSLQVQVITYNTSRTQTTPGQRTIQLDASPQRTTYQTSSQHVPNEYSDTDVHTEISTDVQEFTDVEESKEGDTEITTTTKTYRTLTTEKRLETQSGVKQYMVDRDGKPVKK